MSGRTLAKVLIALAVLSTVARIAYSFHVDPLSGPDSMTYWDAAETIRAHGIFYDQIPGIPYWPLGYPAVVALFGTTGTVILQAALVGVTGWLIYLVARPLGEGSGFVAGVLVTLNPALSAASARLMYEPLLAFLLVAAIVTRDRPYVATSFIGLASVIQPKCLLVGVAFLIWLAWQHRKGLLLAIATLLALPAALLVLNLVNYGAVGLSANLGATMVIGFNDHADGTYNSLGPTTVKDCDLSGESFARDKALVKCSIGWALSHPTRLPKLEAMKAVAFFSPYVGPTTARSTWYSELDWRNVYPAWITEDETFKSVDEVASNIWIVLLVGLLVAGAVMAYRESPSFAVLLLVPVVAFLLVHLTTIGDARFRLPVIPFTIIFQAVALVRVSRVLFPSFQFVRMPQPDRSGWLTSKRCV